MASNKLLSLCTTLFFCIAVSTTTVFAEQKKSIPGYDVHYMAFSTSMLTPEIAKSYRIQRSKTRAVVTISMLDAETQAASAGLVRGEVRNAVGQLQTLDFQKVQEQEAIYYLATFRFVDAETLKFKIEMGPEKATKLHNIEFSQQFFIE